MPSLYEKSLQWFVIFFISTEEVVTFNTTEVKLKYSKLAVGLEFVEYAVCTLICV